MKIVVMSVALLAVMTMCSDERGNTSGSLTALIEGVEKIDGTAEYLSSPFVTAGDRLYMVGHQDGSFPDLGWHLNGEMGGIWAHPIKLMDGFQAGIGLNDSIYCLPPAQEFTNYPMANLLRYPEVNGVEVERFHFVPDGQKGMIVEYALTNTTNEEISFVFTFSGRSDLSPVWLGERTGLNDAIDSIWHDDQLQAIVAKDLENPWYVNFGSAKTPTDYWMYALCSSSNLGSGKEATLLFDMRIPAGKTEYLPITIAGSYISGEDARETYLSIRDESSSMLKDKIKRYDSLASVSSLIIPDDELEQTFRWLKYNTDWLVRDVEGVGRGLSAGIPDYPWWFGADSEYALQGALMTGQWDLVYETIDLIASISDSVNGNGRILHEVSTNGAVFNPGNINETPQFASLIWKVYNWTGDDSFLKKYYPMVVDGLDWLMKSQDADGNYLPDGFGMMEIHGLDSEMIDVAAYTQKAYADAAKMAHVLGNFEEEEAFSNKAVALAEMINTDFWVEDQKSYADFIGTVEQARHLIEAAIHRADSLDKPWAVNELTNTLHSIDGYNHEEKHAFVVYHNWVVNTPMETGVADKEKALAALATGQRFTNPFGIYVTGIDRDEMAGDNTGSFVTNKKIFSYIGAVMTLPTGVQAIAENNYGRPDQALEYLNSMVRSFSYALPGSMYEVSPDYGMIVQAWNIFSFAVPIVEQFFGIYPDASENVIRLSPQMPSSWPEASLDRVRVLDGELSLDYSVLEGVSEWEIVYTGTARLKVDVTKVPDASVSVNGTMVEPQESVEGNFLMLDPGRHTITLR